VVIDKRRNCHPLQEHDCCECSYLFDKKLLLSLLGVE
jgi:hypothetical protein